ncbi:MAG: Omp28-related outer membrane protein [bacterium]|nr:Omp28-related outer membrane protein [bacterium]
MRYRNVIWLALVILVVIAYPAQAARRTVLCETFTQWNCGYCPDQNELEWNVCQQLTRDTLLTIKYHVWWPGSNNDAFYLWNQTEITTRTNYYGVASIGVPYGRCDGIADVSRSESGFRNQVRTRAQVASPCTITLNAAITGETSVSFSGTITATDSAIANQRLFVALLTDRVDYTSAPGTNGETMFYNIFRDMWPNATGETISVAQGASYEFAGTLNKDAAWPSTGLTVVAWVQDYTSKYTRQSGWAPVLNPYQVVMHSSDPHQLIADRNDEIPYYVELENLGSNDDVYTVTVGSSLPAGWTQTIEAEGIEANPNSISVPLASQESTWLILNVRPNGSGGSANLSVTAQSDNNPPTNGEVSFRLMAGLDLLLVDDDGGSTFGNFESYYLNALESAAGNYAWGWWDMSETGAIDGLDLNGVDVVVWFTGSSPNNSTLDLMEQYLLEVYLTSSYGTLFLTGQGIAWDLRTSSFLSEILHVSHNQPYAQGRDVVGIAGDPIGDGLSFNINSSGGAQNQTRQSAIAPYDEMAYTIFDYTGGDYHAGVAVATPDYRAVFLGFGFEAISDATMRETVMERVLGWLNPLAADPRAETAMPTEFALEQNYPNPFNPQTTIPFTLPMRAEVTLRVFDLLGREVATLASGTFDTGYHHLTWDGSGCGSGLYFYRMDAAAGDRTFHATRKLMLLK